MEDALAGDLAAGEARVLGRSFSGDLTWAALIDAVVGPGRSPDALVARLGLRAAVERARVGPAFDTGDTGDTGGTRGFLSAAGRFVAEASRAGITAASLADLAP